MLIRTFKAFYIVRDMRTKKHLVAFHFQAIGYPNQLSKTETSSPNQNWEAAFKKLQLQRESS